MGTLKVNKLLVGSHVGYDPHLSNYKQDIQVSFTVHYNSYVEEESDDPVDAFDTNKLVKEVMGRAESSHFNLLEAFCRMVLNTILEFPRVDRAEVEAKIVQSVPFKGERAFVISGSNM